MAQTRQAREALKTAQGRQQYSAQRQSVGVLRHLQFTETLDIPVDTFYLCPLWTYWVGCLSSQHQRSQHRRLPQCADAYNFVQKMTTMRCQKPRSR